MPKKKKKVEDDNIPHHLVLHKLNDMIQELEKGVKPEQLQELQKKVEDEKKEQGAISYPKIGVAYDPKETNAWTNNRGFQNPASIMQKSSWLGLTVAPGAVPSTLPHPKALIAKNLGQDEEDDINAEDRSDSDSDSDSDESPVKASVFQDIFGEERPPSPERRADDIPLHAFQRRKEAEAEEVSASVPKPAPSNNLAKALQSRLAGRKTEKRKEPTRSKSRSPWEKHRERSRKRSETPSYARRTDDDRSYRSDRKDHNDRIDRYYNRDDRKSESRERSSLDTRRRNRDDEPRRSSSRSNRYSKESSRRQSVDEYNNSPRRQDSHRSSRDRVIESRRSTLEEQNVPNKSYWDDNVIQEVSEGSEDSERQRERKKEKKEKKKRKKNKKKREGRVKLNYDDEEEKSEGDDGSDAGKSIDQEGKRVVGRAEGLAIDSDQEDEEKMIEKIRRKRAKLLARIPEKQEEHDESVNLEDIPTPFEKVSAREGGQLITSFSQDGEEEHADVKKYKTVIVTGSVLNDGQFGQLFQLSATVQGSSNKYFQCSFPELLRRSNSLAAGSRIELMDTLQVKSSKFDVEKEGMMNVSYKHPNLGLIKAVSEKEMLLSFLSFLQSMEDPVVLFFYYMDALLPTILAKLNKFKLFDHFSNLVLYCCDLVGLAWSLHLDHLWTGKHYPSLRTIAESVEEGKGEEFILSPDNAAQKLGSVLHQMMITNHLNMQKVMEMSSKMNLVEYMSVKYTMIQGIRVEEQKSGLPEYLEINNSYDAWGVRSRVDLVWNSLEGIAQMMRGKRSSLLSEKRSTPLPVPEVPDGEDQVTILKPQPSVDPEENLRIRARQLIAAKDEGNWETKRYNVFLSPGQLTIPPNTNQVVELRVPALQLRIEQLVGSIVLVQGSPDFTVCRIQPGVGLIHQSDTALFPFVKVEFRNESYHPVKLSSETVTYPVATLQLEKA